MSAPARGTDAATPAVSESAAAANPGGSDPGFQPTGTLVLERESPAVSAAATTHATPPARPPANSYPCAGPFEFVRLLTIELASGDLKVPSFPDIAERVRRVLNDERASAVQVAQVVASDPALAARVLRIANSSTFNPGSKPITDLPTAIGRVGHELVRCAAVQFALAQMRAAVRAPELRPMLQDSWRRSTLVAAIAYVLARETRAANPDVALVTGLLHEVGRLFIVSRAHLRIADYSSPEVWEVVLRDWHPDVGRTILQHWHFPDTVAAAIAGQASSAHESGRVEPLHAVLVCAIALVPCVWERERLDETIAAVPAFAALGLDGERCRSFLADTAEQIKQLREALAG